MLPGFETDEVDFLSLLSEANRRRVLESSTKAEYPAGAIAYHPESPPLAYVLAAASRALTRACRTAGRPRCVSSIPES